MRAGIHRRHHVIPARLLSPHTFRQKVSCWQDAIKQTWARSIALLLDDDGQVHIQVDATVEMEGAGSVEGSNDDTLTGRADLHVVDDRCSRFYRWFRGVIHPGAIANNV